MQQHIEYESLCLELRKVYVPVRVRVAAAARDWYSDKISERNMVGKDCTVG